MKNEPENKDIEDTKVDIAFHRQQIEFFENVLVEEKKALASLEALLKELVAIVEDVK